MLAPRNRDSQPCRACGELVPYGIAVKTSCYCAECYAELTEGIIPMVTDSRLQSHTQYLTPRQCHGLSKTGG